MYLTSCFVNLKNQLSLHSMEGEPILSDWHFDDPNNFGDIELNTRNRKNKISHVRIFLEVR